MKHIAILILLHMSSLLTTVSATVRALHKYTAEVAGVMCSACSDKVKVSFESLPGVKSVKVKKGDKPAVARVEILSTSEALTKEAAVKSLGGSASSYSIVAFKREPK